MRNELLGATDSQGLLSVPAAAIAGRGLVPESPLYARAVYEVECEVGSSFELMLTPAATLEGVVHLPDGSSAGSGLKVRAIEAAQDDYGASQMWMPLRSAKVAMTDEHGRFVLGQLAEGRAYVLYAGAAGLATLEGTLAVTGRRGDLCLKVQYVLGALVSFSDRERRRPTALHLVHGPERTDWASWSRGRYRSPKSRIAALAGISHDLGFSTNPRLILFSGESPESGPPAKFQCEPLGFAPIADDLHLEWLGGNIPSYELTLEGYNDGLGEVIVMLEGEGSPASAFFGPEAPAPPAMLHLERVRPQVGDRDPEIGLWGIFDGGCSVGGIPHGEYRASVQFSVGSHRFPEYGAPGIPLTVGTEPALLRIPVAGLSSLEVRLWAQSGQPYRGPAVIVVGEGELRSSRRGGTQFTSGPGDTRFTCAPYVFPSLRPNQYHVLLMTPGALELGHSGSRIRSVTLGPGMTAVVDVEIVY
jgi:hypothetical protein